MEKIIEAVGEKNLLDKSGGKKRLVHHFTRQKLWKFIGCILLSVTYGIKVKQLWVTTETSLNKKEQNTPHRDVCGKTYLLKVHCDLYNPHYCYAHH